MILLMHLLEHLGLPAGAALAVSIGVMRVVKTGVRSKIGSRDNHR